MMMGQNGSAAALAVCVVHGKMRSWECLIETGAGPVCAPGSQCKSGVSKAQTCKFFLEGRCAKGPACPFLHDGPPEGLQQGWAPSKGSKSPAAAAGPYSLPPGKGVGKESFGKALSRGKPDWPGEAWGTPDWNGKLDWSGGPDWGSGKPDWGSGKGRADWGGDWGGGGKLAWGSSKGKPEWGADWGGKGWADYNRGEGPPMWAPPDKGVGKGKDLEKGAWQDLSSRALCAVHSKMRSCANLQDMGNGEYVCKEGFECQAMEAGGVKRAMCKFFAQGRCSRGEACVFAHSEEEIGAPLVVDAEAAAPGEPAPAVIGLRVQASGSDASDEDQAVCALHGKRRSMTCLQEADDGSGLVCKPGSACRVTASRPGETPCKFFAQGRCQKGTECPFVHEDPPGGHWNEMQWPSETPSRSSTAPPSGCQDSWKAGTPQAGEFSWGPGPSLSADGQAMCSLHNKMRKCAYVVERPDGTFECSRGNECQDTLAGGIKRSLCKFFQQGLCTRGDACAFAHEEWEIGRPIPEGALGATHKPHFEEPKGNGKGCKGFAEEKAPCSIHHKQRTLSCLQDDGDGSYSCRPGRECKGIGLDGQPRPLCKFYAQGKCVKGEACPFSHDDAGEPFDHEPIGSSGKGKGGRHRYSPYQS